MTAKQMMQRMIKSPGFRSGTVILGAPSKTRTPGNRERDCSRLRGELDCLERNSRKPCPSCAKFAKAELARSQYMDLQDDLDDAMDDLVEVSYDHSGLVIDVANLFNEFVASDNKNRDLVSWADRMAGVRIPVLRKIAHAASGFGLDAVAAIVQKHIALRRVS